LRVIPLRFRHTVTPYKSRRDEIRRARFRQSVTKYTAENYIRIFTNTEFRHAVVSAETSRVTRDKKRPQKRMTSNPGRQLRRPPKTVAGRRTSSRDTSANSTPASMRPLMCVGPSLED